jgi:hypothetical protein
MSGFSGVNQTGTLQINNGGITDLPVSFGYYPPEGSRIASTQYNFATQLQYYEDLSLLKALGMLTGVQSLWVDNSLNPEPVSIIVQGSNQYIQVPAQFQGIVPAFFSDGPGFYVSVPSYSAGTTSIFKMIMLNVPPAAAGLWGVTNIPDTQNGNGVAIPQLSGTRAFPFIASAAGTGVIIPAAAGKRFFITGILATISASATIAAGGDVVFTIQDGAGGVITETFYVPSAAPTTEGLQTILNITGLSYISNAQNQACNWNLGTNFTAGQINGTLFGGYTSSTP